MTRDDLEHRLGGAVLAAFMEHHAFGRMTDNAQLVLWIQEALALLDPIVPGHAELVEDARIIIEALRREDAGEPVDWFQLDAVIKARRARRRSGVLPKS